MRRTGGLSRASAAGVLLVAVAAAGCSDDSDTAEAAPELAPVAPAPERSGDELPPYREPHDDGGIELVDSGFRVFTDEIDREFATFGFVVENTSTMAALATDIRVTFLDGSGEPIASPGFTTPEIVTPTVVLPGEQFGAGGSVDLEGAGQTDPIEPTDLRVEIAGSQWYPAEDRFLEFATITADEVTVSEEPTLASPIELAFTAASEYDRPLSATGTAVLRDEAGNLVGGVDLGGTTEIEPGSSEGELTGDSFQDLPPLDDLGAEVYLVPSSPVPAPDYAPEAS